MEISLIQANENTTDIVTAFSFVDELEIIASATLKYNYTGVVVG